MLKALVWGCGAIGAGYDWDRDEVLTHLRAYATHGHFQLTVCEQDPDLARRVAQRYQAEILVQPTPKALKEFDFVSLCLPTAQHLGALELLVQTETPMILCEKPIVADSPQLHQLQRLPLVRARILVNYIRRFQPVYRALLPELQAWWRSDPLQRIVFRYSRGWLNYGSHALDLLDFWLGDLEIQDITATGAAAAGPDPCYSFRARLGSSIALEVEGRENSPPLFEMEFHAARGNLQLLHSGQRLQFSHGRVLENALQDYMRPVLQQALDWHSRPQQPTNLESALRVNRKLLEIQARLSP
jgi:predicted dehydrogenase